MPVAVVVAAVLLVLLGLTFCVIPVVAYRRGGAAENAAEKEVVRQGFSADVLADHRIQFKESGPEMLLPLGIAAVLFVVAGLDLAGVGPARVISWVVAGILVIAGGLTTGTQVFAARYTAAAFKKSSDLTVRNIDAQAIIDAAAREFPGWLRPVQIVRFLLTTVGLLTVIILLAMPTAGVHFR